MPGILDTWRGRWTHIWGQDILKDEPHLAHRVSESAAQLCESAVSASASRKGHARAQCFAGSESSSPQQVIALEPLPNWEQLGRPILQGIVDERKAAQALKKAQESQAELPAGQGQPEKGTSFSVGDKVLTS